MGLMSVDLETTIAPYWHLLKPYLQSLRGHAEPVVRLVADHPLLTLCSATVGLSTIYYYASRPRNLPPGPWGFPFIGSPHLLSDDVHRDLDRLAKKYGEIYTLMMGTRPMIVINSHRLIKEAFVKRGETFANRPQMFDLDLMELFDELFNHPYTEEWKTHKKFQMRVLRNHGFGSLSIEKIFKPELERFYLDVESQQADGQAVDLAKPLANLCACTITAIIFSGQYNYGDAELEEVIRLITAWVDSMFRCGMAVSYWTDNVPCIITKIFFPSVAKALYTSGTELQEFLIQKINEHRESLEPNHPRDVMDAYLSERGSDPALTDLKLAGTLLMTLPDAIDTTSILLNWIVLYLVLYPKWQAKVQAQIDEVCGKQSPDFTHRSSLPLVEATINEVGRISSVVCLSIAHCPTHDTTLAGYHIPKDSYILANIWAAHREKHIFPQGDSFDPEQLIGEDGRLIKNDKIMYFSCGRRMCIAEPMVKNEAFLFVSNCLHRYTFSLPPGAPLPSMMDTGGLIRSPQPFKVRMLPRDT